MSASDDLQVTADYLGLQAKLEEAKASGDAEQIEAVKLEMYLFRRYWRQVREALTEFVPSGDGVAQPEPIASSFTTSQ